MASCFGCKTYLFVSLLYLNLFYMSVVEIAKSVVEMLGLIMMGLEIRFGHEWISLAWDIERYWP